MSFLNAPLVHIRKLPSQLIGFPRHYAKKVKTTKGIAAVSKVRELAVETDPAKIVTHCCINYRVGEQPIPLKPDSEYPDWLWKLRTDRRPPPLHEIDCNSYQFWRQVRKDNQRTWNKLAAMDGWHRKDHRRVENHSHRFYGQWYIAAQDWIRSKRMIENS